MKLEHKRERVISAKKFAVRLSRYGFFAFMLLAVSVAAGTVGYRYFCNLSWMDSFYMACMILTGMGPVSEMPDDTAKLFSSFFALYSGVAFLSITALIMAPVVHRLLHIMHVEEEDNNK